MRVGYFGGTFDPPHRGHLAVALAAANQFGLGRVLLAPAGRQPLKPEGSHASFAQRLAMVRLLAEADPRLEASTADAPRDDGRPNYTVDTLRTLRAREGAGRQNPDELFVVVGADSLAHLREWHSPDELLALAEWIVVSRPGLDLDGIVADVVPAGARQHIHLLRGVDEPVSATEVRARLRAGLACDELLLPAVARYIREHGLYGAADATGPAVG